MKHYKPTYAPRTEAHCTCTTCQKALDYRKAYYEANKDKIARYAKKYQKSKREALNAYMRAYHKRRKGEANG